MTEEVRKIQDSIYRYKGVKASNQSADDFIQTIYKDIQNMLLTKYPYLDINFLFPKDKEIEEKKKAMLEERRVKGYAFDSLVYRYKAAREEQMRYEQKEALKEGKDGHAAKTRADRDIMAFINILDDIIGDHD